MAKNKTSQIIPIQGASSADRRPYEQRQGDLVCSYPYANERNELVMKVDRLEWIKDNGEPGKSFPKALLLEPRPWPWDVNDPKLAWKPAKLEPKMCPPYRLPELLQAGPDDPVFITEGEKDADNVAKLGAVVTTNIGGAEQWWGPYAFYFEDLRVIVLVDNDEVGKQRGEMLRRELQRVAKSVTVVLLPGLPEKGDVSDWLKAHPEAGLKELLKTCKDKDNRVPLPQKPGDKKFIDDVNRMQRAIRSQEGWRDYKDGKLAPTRNNCEVAIGLLGLSIRYDEFRNLPFLGNARKAIYNGPLDKDATATWISKQIGKVWGLEFSEEMINNNIDDVAWSNTFSPVVDWLNGLKWDGKPRLDTWLTVYCGAEDTQLNRAFGRKWLMAAVRRQFQPGAKFDHMLVLEGEQGIGKSSTFKALAGEAWFTDQFSFHDIGNGKRIIEKTSGFLIIEMGEMKGAGIRETEEVKQFISATIDQDRMSYDRRSSRRPRRFVLGGSTNRDDYLKDDTGNRRTWPVKCNGVLPKGDKMMIDLEGLQGVREQLWAEALVAYGNDENLELDPSLWEAQAEVATLRMALDLTAEVWKASLRAIKLPHEPNGEISEGPLSGKRVWAISVPYIAGLLGLREAHFVGRGYHGTKVRQLMKEIGWEMPVKIRFDDKSRRRSFWCEVKPEWQEEEM